MQTTRITIFLSTAEREALRILAQEDLRDPREHLRFLLRQALRERGLLADDPCLACSLCLDAAEMTHAAENA